MPKTKRKPGEKPKTGRRTPPAPLPQFSELQSPHGFTVLAEFVLSCAGEVSALDAIREFQTEWCDHPKTMQYLIATISSVIPENCAYIVCCGDCARRKEYRGRPPKELVR